MLEHIVLADHPMAIFQKIAQQVEHLRLDRNAFAAAAQLPPVGIKHMIYKEKFHLTNPGPSGPQETIRLL
jgi:hypothetical protein